MPGAECDKAGTETPLTSKVLEINVIGEVKDKYEYGPQGKDTAKQSVEMIAPAEITQLYPNADGQPADYYLNRIETPFEAAEPIAFTFKMGKGMGGGYDEAAFIEGAIFRIAVYDANEENILAGYAKGNLVFAGRNELDRSVTVQLAEGTLQPGNYVLVFDETMCTVSGSAPLGVDVKFQFTVSDPDQENPVPDDENKPSDEETISDNELASGTDSSDDNVVVKADETTPTTGDSMNPVLIGVIALAALVVIIGIALTSRRRK